MEHLITQAPEPKKLYLAWQAPDHMGRRQRWAVGVIESRDDGLALRYFQDDEEFRRLNGGCSLTDAKALSYQGYPGLPLIRQVWPGIQSALMRRLPPRTRHDFREYIDQFRIAPELQLSDFSLLGITEAKLPSDGFSLVDPFSPEDAERDLVLEVAGFRYYRDKVNHLSIGDEVAIVPERNNEHDTDAVMFLCNGQKIGNVNRLQAPTFRRWLSEGVVTGSLERLNGNAAKPRAFVFVQMRRQATSAKRELAEAY